MKIRKMTGITIIMILISFVFTTVISLTSLNRVINDNTKDVATILAARIYDHINSELSEPIMVARTMSCDSFLEQCLKEEETMSEEEMLSHMAGYLNTIKTELEYNTAFVISENSRKYYTYEGLNKLVSPEEDAHDIWYSIFVNGGKDYDFDVDHDEVNDNAWTIFVNSRIEDEEGHLLGVCGVGIGMQEIQKSIHEFEEQYHVKVNLVNKEGLVQVDTNSINVETAVIEDVTSATDQHGEYIYAKDPSGSYRVMKYLEDFGWYLVIQNQDTGSNRLYSSIIIKNVIAFFVILLILLVSVKIILDRAKNKLVENATIDQLTKLANRNFFKYHIEENEENIEKLYGSIALFDIDNFKGVNDTMGHLKGDEILKEVSLWAKEVINENGQIIRWGGDEFMILFYSNVPGAYLLCEELRKKIENMSEVTISIGLCPVKNTIKNSFYRADQLLYQAKAAGRNCIISVEESPAS